MSAQCCNYQVLFVHRNLSEIAASQNTMLRRRGERNDTSDERALQLLAQQVSDARFFLRQPHFEVLELSYKEMLESPGPHAQRIADFVGQPLDVEKMASVVDVRLYRTRSEGR
jgi:hypothetical protein